MFLHVPYAPIWPPEPGRRGHRRTSSQNWRTFVRNHAQSIVACDFLVVVTARFRTLYVFFLMEVGTRRIVHCNVTAHPTATWTLQQLREAIPSDHSHRFLIHDRDSIVSAEVDQQLKAFGLRVLHTPARAPKANAYCERQRSGLAGLRAASAARAPDGRSCSPYGQDEVRTMGVKGSQIPLLWDDALRRFDST
jgi:transposase InsO family protein